MKLTHYFITLLLGIALGGTLTAIALEKHCQNVLQKAMIIKESKNV